MSCYINVIKRNGFLFLIRLKNLFVIVMFNCVDGFWILVFFKYWVCKVEIR